MADQDDILGGLVVFLREEISGSDVQIVDDENELRNIETKSRQIVLLTTSQPVHLWLEHRDGKVFVAKASYAWGPGIDLSLPDALDRLKHDVLRLLNDW